MTIPPDAEGRACHTRPRQLWAKLKRNENDHVVAWHSLIDHSADVAACSEAILQCSAPAARLARLAGCNSLDKVTISRLSVFAGLHDFGNANAGFQARWSRKAPFVGHCREGLAVLRDADFEALAQVLPLREISDNDPKPWRKKMWRIAKIDGEYIVRMEDLLDLYAEPHDPKRPVVCSDESPIQLTAEVRESIKPRRSCGVAVCIF